MAKRAHLVDINDLAGVDHGNLPCNVLDLAEHVRRHEDRRTGGLVLENQVQKLPL